MAAQSQAGCAACCLATMQSLLFRFSIVLRQSVLLRQSTLTNDEEDDPLPASINAVSNPPKRASTMRICHGYH